MLTLAPARRCIPPGSFAVRTNQDENRREHQQRCAPRRRERSTFHRPFAPTPIPVQSAASRARFIGRPSVRSRSLSALSSRRPRRTACDTIFRGLASCAAICRGARIVLQLFPALCGVRICGVRWRTTLAGFQTIADHFGLPFWGGFQPGTRHRGSMEH